jgi:transcriptional regulator with XRE-family HTH domain
MSLSQKLSELRKRKGESLAKVAENIGISQQHVWQLEIGKSRNPSLDILRSYARYFGVSVEFLSQLDGETDRDAVNFYLDFHGQLSSDDWRLLRSVAEQMSSGRTPCAIEGRISG